MLLRNKDFTSRYAAETLDDWQFSDWGDLTTALKLAVMDCFAQGSDPEATLESDVIPQFTAALRQYVSDGVALGYDGSQQDSYGMMGMAGAGVEGKAGYINAQNHDAAITALDAIAKHAKTAKRALASVSSARGFNDRAGTPIYSGASSLVFFEQKEDEEDEAALIKSLTTSLTVANSLREAKDDLTSPDMTANPVDDVDAALAALLDKRR